MGTNASPAEETPHSAIGYRAYVPGYHKDAEATSGPAQTTEQKRRSDRLAQLGSKRAALMERKNRLLLLRRAKAASSIEAEIAAINIEILREKP